VDAARFEDESLTYSELNRQANRLARRLVSAGLAPAMPVVICVEPGLLTAVAILGVLKAGGAYVPVSPSYPAHRIAYVIKDSRAAIILTQSHLLSKVEGLSLNAISLDRANELSVDLDASNLDLAVEPRQGAYILYTSGSSGDPKGVVVPHSSLSYYLRWHVRHLRAEIGHVDLPLTASICFAAAVTQFYTPLLLGRTLHVMREDAVRQPEQLFAWYAAHPEYGIYCVPTLWNELVTFAERLQQSGESVEPPKCVLLSGEAVSEKLIERSHAVWSDIAIWNLYGPTEATANGSAGRLRPGHPITLGKSIAGTEIYLVDEEMREVALGDVGEICICGEGVAEGYLNLPELTRERFLTNPFEQSGTRLFRTGDLARYDDEGDLIFIGRKDSQVKIRGYRVECGEVEQALSAHEAVRQSVVVCRDVASLDRQLVAYLTFHFTRYASVDELRAFLSARLPDYMIPSAFVALDAFPQLANGKVDRAKLPPPGNSRPHLGYDFAPPKSQKEKQLVRIWEESLGIEGVGADDNFFDLGGDSLKVAAAVSRIRETLHADVTFRQLFDSPTPSTLAKTLKASEHDGARAASRIERSPASATYPCAFNQQSLWLLSQTVPDLSAYNIQFSLRLEGVLNFDALAKSLGEILRRHDALRAVVVANNDRPSLRVAEFVEPTIEVADLRELDEESREDRASRIAAEDCARPFDLARAPLYRFKLCRLADERHILFVTVHHFVFDGRSINIFAGEFVENYRAHAAGKLPRRANDSLRHQDYVAWQTRQLEGQAYETSLQFWKESLEGGSQILDFPTDYTRPKVQTFNGACEKVRLPAELRDNLGEFSRREQATPFMSLLSVFYALLHRYSDQEDILVGCAVANRPHSDLEGLIGYLANVVALRAKPSKDQRFSDLLSSVRETCLQSFEHQAIPFEKIVEALRPERSLSHTPLFQVMFGYHEKLLKVRVDDSLRLETYEDGNSEAKFDLVLDAQELESGFEIRLNYNTDLFAPATARRILRQYVRLLENVIANAAKPIAEYELVSEEERWTLIRDWNATAFDNERERCLHRLFEGQARENPERTALIFGGLRLSYDALNRRANQLARHLIARGVGEGVAVGVHMDRSAEMIVALLAILKAGGAYVPLDPHYPKERIAYIVEDSRVPVIVTDRELEGRLSAHSAMLVVPDSEWQEIGEYADDDLIDVRADADSLMYVMYTSGSTGNPKGVLLPHRGACNYVLWMRERFPLTADDKILSKTSINFDISVWEIFLPLISGAQLVVGGSDELQAPENLAALIRRERITQVQFVPSSLKAFADSGWLAACDSLQRIFSGGEALSTKLRDEVFASFAGELHNLYGPTEASIYICHHACRADERARSVAIGRPVHNARVYLLDERLSPAAVGMIGEAYLGGDALAQGYFGKPGITAAKFLPDPFSPVPGARMFKTGDLARYLSDGEIEFLGRADRQVKVRGYRIELGEIEHRLSKHPQVKHAIVIVREDKADDVRLVAYLLYRDHTAPANAELREHLKQKLPDYMIPATFVELDSIPLLPNNKVDIKSLPRPEFKKTLDEELERNYGDDCEKALARIWEEVLGTEKFGPNDNFFDVGGHSLLVVRLRTLIKERINVEVSNIDVFQYASIRSLSRHINRRGNGATDVISEMARRANLRNQRLKQRTT
jgi:amino acid adenylation domain-containing protein